MSYDAIGVYGNHISDEGDTQHWKSTQHFSKSYDRRFEFNVFILRQLLTFKFSPYRSAESVNQKWVQICVLCVSRLKIGHDVI